MLCPLLLGDRGLEAMREDAGDRRPARVAEVAINVGEEAWVINKAVERRLEMVSRYSIINDEILLRGERSMLKERPGENMDFVPAVLHADMNGINADRRTGDIINRIERALEGRRRRNGAGNLER